MLSRLFKLFSPTERDVFLHETTLRGANYYDARDLIEQGELCVGDTVKLRREATNPHDEYAVAVFSTRGQKLAYLPKAQNHIVACLLDNDEQVRAEVSKVNGKLHEPIWVKIWLLERKTY